MAFLTFFKFTKGRPLFDYMGSEAGRTSLIVSSGLMGAAVAVALWTPECLALKYVKNNLQMYKDGYAVKPTNYVIDLAAQTLADCKIPNEEAKQIKWFTAFGFDTMCKGQQNFSKGCIIGVPKTFSYNSPEEVDRTSIKMHRDKSIPWKSEAGDALQTSIVFSDDARKAAIAREIFHSQTNHVWARAMTFGAVIPALTALVSMLNERFGMRRFPRAVRVATYSVWTILGAAGALALWDSINREYERDADAKVAALGQKYVEGAIELYSKQMLTNRALRELLGPEGLKSFSAEGNRNYIFRQPHKALSARKDFFEKKLKLLKKAQEEVLNPTAQDANLE